MRRTFPVAHKCTTTCAFICYQWSCFIFKHVLQQRSSQNIISLGDKYKLIACFLKVPQVLYVLGTMGSAEQRDGRNNKVAAAIQRRGGGRLSAPPLCNIFKSTAYYAQQRQWYEWKRRSHHFHTSSAASSTNFHRFCHCYEVELEGRGG